MLIDAITEEAEQAAWSTGSLMPTHDLYEQKQHTDPFDKIPGTAIELVPTLEVRLKGEWGKAYRHLADRKMRTEQWFIECVANGHECLNQSVDIDPEIHGGMPVLHGTRFTVSQALAELAETKGPSDFAEDFDLNPESVRNLLMALSLVFQRPSQR